MSTRFLVLALTACGRLGFGTVGDAPLSDDSPTDGVPVDGAGRALVAGMTTCQPSPTTLTLDRDAQAGDTLLVAFFMREPATTTLPTISGGNVGWVSDAAFSSALSTNRRHLSLFRTAVVSLIVAGTQLAITHPGVESSGAVAFVVPATVTMPPQELPAVSEGGNNGMFSGTTGTTAATTLCGVVHHNNTSAQFGLEWTPLFDLPASCGEGARQSAGLHLALGPGGNTVDCNGMLGNSFTWITVLVGYNGLR